MRRHAISILAAMALLAGCTPPYTKAPIPTHFEASEQRKLHSAHHWKVIADDAASALLLQLESTRCQPSQPVCSRGLHEGIKLHVKHNATDSQFLRAFKQSLIHSLLEANAFRITKNPNDPDLLVIDVGTEYVRWGNRVSRDPLIGEMSALATGLWVLRTVRDKVSYGAATTGAAVSADIYFAKTSKYAKGPRPRHELVVTVTASDHQYYYAHTNNVYYTSERGFYRHYAGRKIPRPQPQLPSSTLRVKGSTP